MTTQQVQFTSFDGARLFGVITLPVSRAWAVALLTHGLPSDKEEWGFYTDFAAHLASVGVQSLRFDFRYCGDSEPGDLSDIALAAMWNDIDAAARVAASSVTPSIPFFLIATSASGGVALQWANDRPGLVAHAFLMAPVLDYSFEVLGRPRSEVLLLPEVDHAVVASLARTGKVSNESPYGRWMVNDARRFDGGSEVRRATTPLSVFQGTNDSVVPLSLTRAVLAQSAVELVTVARADHGFAAVGDDDLRHPETKRNHHAVYALVSHTMRTYERES